MEIWLFHVSSFLHQRGRWYIYLSTRSQTFHELVLTPPSGVCFFRPSVGLSRDVTEQGICRTACCVGKLVTMQQVDKL
ncbi:hypothetical protein HOLleu_20493 [Holothuria leucospilota]|uniref:Uncharacterized protein n=1 Tax=Holothuria leucospilota TaxID=206669 RepID=A0A9Q1H8I1_HOLLE|nr:hypothetical protein HOLleu_20493 [Holothuria leucospilota]